MPFIQINDVKLYYEFQGPETAPVLVLNNGVIMNAATSWIFQTKTLAKGYRVLQYDCRGQGQSDHPDEPYTMDLHADDLYSLMNAFGIETAHIAGISYGGEVAQAFVLKYPKKTRSLLLIDTVSEIGLELRIVIESWIDAMKSGNHLAFFNASVPWNFSPEFIKANPVLLEDAKKRYALLDFQAVIRLCQCFLDVNFTDRLEEIKTPVCIIVGEQDLIKGPRYARILHENIPYSELHVLKGSGHASCWERPEELNSVIMGFLAKNP
jgi:3-oxoadipate enol-lactonase